MNKSLEILSANLKWLRKYLKISQEEFAEKIGTARTNLSNYESGKNEIMLTTLIKISNYCEISTDNLISCVLDENIYKKTKQNFVNKNRSLENFSRNLKKLRNENNMYQVELANNIGLSKSKISVYEAGKSDITLSSLLKITKYFNVSIEKIISFEIDYIQFFNKLNIDFKELHSDREFLRFLYNLKETYNKQSKVLSNFVNRDIPNKLKEIDELITLISNKEKH